MWPLACEWRRLARWEAWRNTHFFVLALRKHVLHKPGRVWLSDQRLLHVALQLVGTGFRTLPRYDGSCEFNYDGGWAVHAVDVGRDASGVEGKLSELRRATARAGGHAYLDDEESARLLRHPRRARRAHARDRRAPAAAGRQ